jgi:hypothetical protein
VKAAQSSCCSIITTISDADADYYLGYYGNVTTKVQTVLSSLSAKKSSYNFITEVFVQNRIKYLNDISNGLNTCLGIFTPQSKSSILQDYINKINTSFTATRAAYNV